MRNLCLHISSSLALKSTCNANIFHSIELLSGRQTLKTFSKSTRAKRVRATMVRRTGYFSPNFATASSSAYPQHGDHSPPASGNSIGIPSTSEHESNGAMQPHYHRAPHNGSYTMKDFPCWSKDCDEGKDKKVAAGLSSVRSSRAAGNTLSWLLEDEKFSFGFS